MNSPAWHWRQALLREASGSSRTDQFSAGLTGIRGLAAMMVLLHHVFALAGPRVLSINLGDWQLTYHWLITVGWMGANVFFVLSGFLLAIPFVGNIEGVGARVAIATYLARRIRRVVPAYWFQIVILAAVLYFTATLPVWQALILHFAFLQNFNQAYAFALNGVYWTLPTEFGYYLLLPIFATLAALFAAHKRAAWLIFSVSLIAFAVAYRVVAYAAVAEASTDKKVFALLQLPGLIDHFAIGMLLAWVYVRHAARVSSSQADAVMLTGLIGIVSMMALLDHVYADYWNGHILIYIGYTITACFIGMLVLGVAMAGRLSRVLFANSMMLALGIVSYSLYLWHLPIQFWTQKLLDHFSVSGDRLWWLVAISIPLSLMAATLSYYWIERPFMPRARSAPPNSSISAPSRL